MQRAYEDDPIARLQYVVHFPFEFPIAVIDQNENPWPHTIALDKELFPLLDHVLANVGHQRTHIRQR